ncbi:inorganic phosphate transporter [Atopobium sp. oral taxon 199]|uniref:inorganic phosphate transporter n=1 Tax=Atopobium sp. oral taxon 199 TaxID=712156 RepID=UPI00034E077E|nr:inorganic phosphate transporter [Atopobium sp. oral taxon 199]EPD77735.1 PiT family inorganic phosphate transporter [Atopobium sp. oral taxon 199 str. F0494]
MITLGRFVDMIVANPFLAVVIVLIFGCIFVNGATDAANAIAESVGTRSIKVNHAIAMSVICNFVGLVVMCLVSTAVADTIIGMVDFGTDYHQALIALAAGCVGIVAWAVGAWALGIPTSESHALIAGLTGAALALHGNFNAVNWDEWNKVIIGLIFSTISGFIAGWVIVKIIHTTCKHVNRKRADAIFGHLQVVGSGFVAMMHGAQDGQKFLSIAMLAIALSAGSGTAGTEVFPLWLQVACAGLMAFGTAIGGRRIIKKVGMEMVKLERYQGFAASFSAAASLLLSTLTGLPVSTTHTKMTAMMGAGAAKNPRTVNWGVAKDMVLAWVFTFPGCGLIGYLFAKLFLMLF